MDCFGDLNEELRKLGRKGEIGIVGDAIMCLVFNARQATRDVDAIFEPGQTIREAAARVGRRRGLPPDWLNDAAKGYLTGNFKRQEVGRFSNLAVWAPEARYMLAIKCLSAWWDTSDRDDVVFLIEHLKLRKATQVLDLIQSYYPKEQIPAKTQFFLEEILP